VKVLQIEMRQKSNSKIVRGRKKIPKKRIKNTQDEERRTWKQWLFIFILTIFIGSIAYMFLCSGLSKVTEISISGNTRINSEDINDTIKNLITGSLTGCISKDNYFFIDKKEIIENILKDKRIKSIKVKKQFPNKISVNVVEHDVIAVWCLHDISGECFVIDGGNALKQIPLNDEVLINNNYFIVVDESGESIEIGSHVIDQNELDKIDFLGKEFIYNINVGIETPYKIVSRGSNEVRFNTDENWYIVVDVTHDTEEILNIAKLFIKKVELPSSRNDLEYIDMRFPEKIFYKMKDGVEQPEENLDKESENDEEQKDTDESNE
jgi:POTRA domain, FtsQ-type